MEVIYPSSKCEVNGAHYFIEAIDLSGIFQCKHCRVVKWQPVYWSDAVKMSELIKKYGLDKAYNISIAHRKKTKSIVLALSEIDGLVISPETQQELRAENTEVEATPWAGVEANENFYISRDKKAGKKKRKKERKLVC